MFNWLKKIFTHPTPTTIPESLRFVRNLCEKHPDPFVTEDWWSGYIYQFKLAFPDELDIKIELNTVRNTWDMSIWSPTTGFLFYYDCLSPKPMSAINFLIGRFNIQEKAKIFVAKKREEEQKRADAAAVLKAKYLG